MVTIHVPPGSIRPPPGRGAWPASLGPGNRVQEPVKRASSEAGGAPGRERDASGTSCRQHARRRAKLSAAGAGACGAAVHAGPPPLPIPLRSTPFYSVLRLPSIGGGTQAAKMPQSGFPAIARIESRAESPPFPQAAANVCSMEKLPAAARLGNGSFALLAAATQMRTIRPAVVGRHPGIVDEGTEAGGSVREYRLMCILLAAAHADDLRRRVPKLRHAPVGVFSVPGS